ncbi:hypothetical protein K8R33_04300 [archaeon]|nr:hypothetical protein [archaeon]
MKQDTKKQVNNIIFSILVILVLTTGIISNYETNCYYDEECFNQAFFECTKAKVIAYENDNVFEYKILNKEGDSCKVQIKIIEVNPEADFITKQGFQDKNMTCTLPIQDGFTTSKLNYCKGPLKEAIYELTIQKMYNLLARNLGEIISEMG